MFVLGEGGKEPRPLLDKHRFTNNAVPSASPPPHTYRLESFPNRCQIISSLFYLADAWSMLFENEERERERWERTKSGRRRLVENQAPLSSPLDPRKRREKLFLRRITPSFENEPNLLDRGEVVVGGARTKGRDTSTRHLTDTRHVPASCWTRSRILEIFNLSRMGIGFAVDSLCTRFYNFGIEENWNGRGKKIEFSSPLKAFPLPPS